MPAFFFAVAATLCGQPGTLRAGVARIEITPAADAALPMSGYAGRTEGHKSIHDNLYTRAIVVDDGAARGAVVTCDLIGLSHERAGSLRQRIAAETQIPLEHILLAGTHTHGGPALGTYREAVGANTTAYLAELEQKVVEVARQAEARLQSARMGVGYGRASVNMNRRALMANGGWWLGLNPDGPSDKTVAVVKFESAGGEPLAVLINYAVHGTVLGQRNLEITADLPGATSRWVEQHFSERVVAPFTSGAAGDQDPIYRVGTDFEQLGALGRILGEEVVRVAQNIPTSPHARIRGAQKVVECPGKKPQGRRRDLNYVFEDADPVQIRLSLLRIGPVALGGVSGEVLTRIGERFKKESPLRHTMMVTHCNGSSGYLPDDAAYDQISYEITTTRVKRGCAENAIVNGLLELMEP